MSYSGYLKSSHWKETREKRLNSNPHKSSSPRVCEICGSKRNLHIHHGRYSIDLRTAIFGSKDRKPGSILGQEISEELFVFCSSCHKLWHHYFWPLYPKSKLIFKIRFLIKAGAVKNKAFWVASQPELFQVFFDKYEHIYKTMKGGELNDR